MWDFAYSCETTCEPFGEFLDLGLTAPSPFCYWHICDQISSISALPAHLFHREVFLLLITHYEVLSDVSRLSYFCKKKKKSNFNSSKFWQTLEIFFCVISSIKKDLLSPECIWVRKEFMLFFLRKCVLPLVGERRAERREEAVPVR